MQNKNIVQTVKQTSLSKVKTIVRDLFVNNWGIKLISIVITIILWFLAHSEKF